jgi:CTP:molybdopterin cytidylyltransferase MocA
MASEAEGGVVMGVSVSEDGVTCEAQPASTSVTAKPTPRLNASPPWILDNAPMQTAAVILAAGAASRFGSPKQLARIGGRTLLQIVADVAREAGLQPVIAVVPPGMAVPPTVVPVINDAPSEGLSRSLRLGLAAVPAEVGAAVILLGDQPTLAAATIRLVVDAAAGDRPVVAASAAGLVGPPVLLRREAFALAHEAAGDEGLRSILARHPELVTAVEVEEHALDIDTREDLASLGER